jgi:hypothetical protein
MSDRGAADEDPCQGERDLLQALLDSMPESARKRAEERELKRKLIERGGQP